MFLFLRGFRELIKCTLIFDATEKFDNAFLVMVAKYFFVSIREIKDYSQIDRNIIMAVN